MRQKRAVNVLLLQQQTERWKGGGEEREKGGGDEQGCKGGRSKKSADGMDCVAGLTWGHS